MEGPSLAILAEELQPFVGRTIDRASGNAKIDIPGLVGQRIRSVRSFGKLLLIQLPREYIRVHFLMWGSYRIDESKERPPRLELEVQNRVLRLYSCAVRIEPGVAEDAFDWRIDTISPEWSRARVQRLLATRTDELLCDVLLDQDVFAGLGNIMKNEILYRVRLNPMTVLGELSSAERLRLVNDVREYAFRFYEWKKAFVLKKNWLIYRKRVCRSCGGQLSIEHTGRLERLSYWCRQCQPRKKPSGSARAQSAPRRKTGSKRPHSTL